VDKEEQEKKERKQRKLDLDKKRKEDKEEKAQKEKQDLGDRIEMEEQTDSQFDLGEQDANNNPEFVVEGLRVTDFLKTRNMVEVSGLANKAIRYDASSRLAGALATAFLGDLIKAGVLPAEATSVSVDWAKVQRAKDKMMGDAMMRGNNITEQDSIRCVMFDSRIDRKTRVRHYDEETHKFFPGVEAEDHYTDGQGR
jgi:hypothetical protein